MTKRLDGKVAIVTGGNSGIGEATAHLFAREGARVALMARREKEGLKVQEAIKREGGEATFIRCDVMDRKAVDFIKVLGLLGRGLAVPPGTPNDTVTTLRAAYDKMNLDPAFSKALKKRLLRLIPSTGAEIEKIVAKALDASSPAVVAHARKLIYGRMGKKK